MDEIGKLKSSYLGNLRLCPIWFNPKDHSSVCGSRSNPINRHYFELDGFLNFIKYLGAKEDSLEDMIADINASKISANGSHVTFYK